MKTCDYCGRENEDVSTRCRECGTCLDPAPTLSAGQLVELDLPPVVPMALKVVALVLTLASVYLLSFGPVSRYCTIRKNTPMTSLMLGFPTTTVSTTVTYPAWVKVVYKPALSIANRGLYGKYIMWWMGR